MSGQPAMERDAPRSRAHQTRRSASEDDLRGRLVAGLPVIERRLDVAGISTAVLEGGDGPPMVLLHGPGESALWWMRVLPDLVSTHRVVAPDLPAHGASASSEGPLDADRVLSWLDGVIERTCPSAPTVVGHLLGGAIAARFAVGRENRIRRLVLVDVLGLSWFRPSPKFAFGLIRFLARPAKRNYDRFLTQCLFDPDDLREGMGERWNPFIAYNLERARVPEAKAGLRTLMLKLGIPAIPKEDLARIAVPTTLIWGRHDQAIKLRVAEDASARYGWPLHVIDEARDDPKLERPEAFLRALRGALEAT